MVPKVWLVRFVCFPSFISRGRKMLKACFHISTSVKTSFFKALLNSLELKIWRNEMFVWGGKYKSRLILGMKLKRKKCWEGSVSVWLWSHWGGFHPRKWDGCFGLAKTPQQFLISIAVLDFLFFLSAKNVGILFKSGGSKKSNYVQQAHPLLRYASL